MNSIRMATTTKSQSITRVKKKTVFVVDDHPLLRQGLALLINREQDLTVCGEAEEAQAAMREIAAKKAECPDCRHLAEWSGRAGTIEEHPHLISDPSRVDPLHA